MNQDRPLTGTLTISIDLAHESRNSPSCPLSTRLRSLVQNTRIPATWAFDYPGSSSLATQIHRGKAGHEIALLCQRKWAADTAGRTAFAQQLKHRVWSAKQAGLNVSTLAMRSADLTEDLDLLVKGGVSVIRGRLDGRRQATRGQPELARFGVWHAPVSIVLTSGHNWPWSRSSRLWRKTILNAVRPSGYAHLGIDLDALTHDSLRTIESAIHAAVQMQENGGLRIVTLHEFAEQLTRKRTQPAARSVLHAA